MCVLVSFGVRVVHHSAGSCILLGLVLLALHFAKSIGSHIIACFSKYSRPSAHRAPSFHLRPPLALLRIQINYAVLPGQYVLLARLSTEVAVLVVVLSLDDLLLL